LTRAIEMWALRQLSLDSQRSPRLAARPSREFAATTKRPQLIVGF